MTFPNFKNKYGCSSVITPQKLIAYRKKMKAYPRFNPPRNLILCYTGRLLNHVLTNHKTVLVKGFNPPFYLINDTNNQVGVIRSVLGAPASCMLFEELIALGIKNFISIGEAGGLLTNLAIGDIVVCDRAIRDEGTSHHYLKPSKYSYASKVLTERCKAALASLEVSCRVGTSWTVDAPYRETFAEVKKYQKEGVYTVEMEASALFAVAKYRNVDLSAIFTVSDLLGRKKWKMKAHYSEHNWEMLFQAAKKALLNIR
ncbi:MAG: nucleoside phosphorylase [Planctomycetes bacterium]|nr:nucleoside phosphorylase [Planctomycetota bacterium]